MKKAKVVIGANFGDEGKGLITDFFSAGTAGAALVVRFNGGAQAGHTVTAPDGRRHVFSHFGAGCFTGAETLLSRYFVCNPLLFLKERALLREQGVDPVVHVDLSAPVTTPYDMMINQIVEDARGDRRHGSCGMGFGETLERNLNAGFRLTYADLFDASTLRAKLCLIRKDWVPARLTRLGVDKVSAEWTARLMSDGIVDAYLRDTEIFLDLTRAATSSFLSTTRRSVVFEGAQGLLLDQDRGAFPHVTRSNTGIRNVLALAEAAGFDALDVAYATRAYLTRHGAGPLAGEMTGLPYAGIVDKTNVTNAYQGALRFAYLDTAQLGAAILQDLGDNAGGRLRVTHGVAVSCMDQVGGDVLVREKGGLQTRTMESFLRDIERRSGADFMLASWGPTRSDVYDMTREISSSAGWAGLAVPA